MASRYRNAREFEAYNLEDGYKHVPAVDPDWSDSDMRVAVVLQSIDKTDLKEGTLYLRDGDTTSQTSTALSNCFRVATVLASKINNGKKPEFKLAVVNWNARKTYHLSENAAQASYKEFTKRTRKILQELDPTHVLVVGDQAGHHLLPKIENLKYKRGWIFDRKGVKWCVTLNVENLVNSVVSEDAEESVDADDAKHKGVDLLFYVTRNISNLLLGYQPFNISHVTPKPVYISSLQRFDKLMDKLYAATDLIGLDTETRNLESYGNAIYTIQFAFNENKGYVLPIDHPKTPFSEKERKYIKKKLRGFFAIKDPDELKTFVTVNGAFDFRILRAQLRINFIHHKVHELTAGEALLDENLGVFTRVGMRDGNAEVKDGKVEFTKGRLESRENLQSLVTSYGNDWYFNAPFSKQDRIQLGLYEPDDPNVLNYASMDVQTPLAVSKLQYEQAKLLSTYDYTKEKIVNYGRFYRTHLIKQMGATTMNISTLEQHGCYVDLPYMLQLLGEKSPLKETLEQTLEEFRKLPKVQEANLELSKQSGSGGRSLFGKNPFILSLSKPAHKIKLFIETLKLEPLTLTKTGQPKIDKAFNNEYARTHKEVELYAEYQEIMKLLSTYVRGWIKKLSENQDSRKDSRLRARYVFFRIISGRLGSFDPNLQQIPSRGKKAKVIKRMFIAPRGSLQIRADYSAHEVRFWAILAKDKVLAGAFRMALELKQQLVQTIPGKVRDKLLKRLKREGDIHLMNVYIFFGQWVEKSHPFRDLIKSTIFGLIYGMIVASLARDRKNKMVSDARVAAEGKFESSKDQKKAEKFLQQLLDKSDDEWKEESQEVVDKVFSRFPAGAQHLERVSRDVVKHGWVSAPTGRRRNMYRVFSGNKSAISAAQRSAKNAPIQGIASEVGMRAANIVLRECDLFFTELDMVHFPLFTRTVHDENSFEVPYEIVVPFLWIYQYCSMFLVKEEFERDYSFPFLVEPEVEVKISSREDSTHVWDWTLDNLRECLSKAIDDQVTTGQIEEDEKENVMEKILAFPRDRKRMNLLQKRYPLLNVELPKEALNLLIK